jgi:hypothetical protein
VRIPYTEVAPGVFRPLLAMLIWGPTRPVLVEGLLDTASDRTLLPPKWARDLGIDVGALTTTLTVRSATGQRVACKTTVLPLEIRRDSTRLCWLGEVAITTEVVRIPHWGFKGFLEYFQANFDGPNRFATLTAGDNLPVTTPPAPPESPKS